MVSVIESKSSFYKSLSHAVGVTDDYNHCDCCGKTNIKVVVVFELKDPIGDDHPLIPGYRLLGTTCAANVKSYSRDPIHKSKKTKIKNIEAFKTLTTTGTFDDGYTQGKVVITYHGKDNRFSIEVNGNAPQSNSQYRNFFKIHAMMCNWSVAELGAMQFACFQNIVNAANPYTPNALEWIGDLVEKTLKTQGVNTDFEYIGCPD